MVSPFAFSILPNPIQFYYNVDSQDGYPELNKIGTPLPNPVIDYAEVWYNIPQDKNAEIAVYNFTGVKVKSIPVSGGLNRVNLEAYDLQPGVYFICLIYEGKNLDSKKFMKK